VQFKDKEPSEKKKKGRKGHLLKSGKAVKKRTQGGLGHQKKYLMNATAKKKQTVEGARSNWGGKLKGPGRKGGFLWERKVKPN